MPKEERETEKPDNIVKLVEEILSFNKQKQQGEGVKILTPSQMLSRLPISLAQLQAGNNNNNYCCCCCCCCCFCCCCYY